MWLRTTITTACGELGMGARARNRQKNTVVGVVASEAANLREPEAIAVEAEHLIQALSVASDTQLHGALPVRTLVVALKSVGRWPCSVSGHVELIGKRLPPSGRLERFAPVVRDANRLPVPQIGDGDVAIDATVPVVRAPPTTKVSPQR
jgi:hypothetical protein